MGRSQSKPEFISILADKHVQVGDTIILRCETNIKDLKATWKKNSYTLQCVEGKHSMKRDGTSIWLEIENAEEADEGIYTLTLDHAKGNGTCSAMVTVELNEWRSIQRETETMMETLKSFKVSNGEVKELRFLLYGPIGAGKSSVINTIKTNFENRQFITCLAAEASGLSFTHYYQKFPVGGGQSGYFPLAFYDIMGLEGGELKGAHPDDIIKAVKGHIPDKYKFDPKSSISEDHRHYNRKPGLNNQIHCLVSVVPADKISLMDPKVIQKMSKIREAASELGIPQVVFMTKVDSICMMTKSDLDKIYRSKKIKEKVQECSNVLGIPQNCIFPVKCYHDETQPSDKINCLMLNALVQIVHSANDFVERCSNKQEYAE